MDNYAVEVLSLFNQILEICEEEDVSKVEDEMNAVDVDHHQRTTAAQSFFTSLPVDLDLQVGATTRGASRAHQAQQAQPETPRVQFKEQQGLRPPLLMLTSTMTEFSNWKTA